MLSNTKFLVGTRLNTLKSILKKDKDYYGPLKIVDLYEHKWQSQCSLPTCNGNEEILGSFLSVFYLLLLGAVIVG